MYHPRRKHSRDVTPHGDVAEPRSIARYRREVVALLAAGHRIHPQKGLWLVRRWDRYVRAKWRMGRPPCNVADHLSKFQKVLKPAERDASRVRRRRGQRLTRKPHARARVMAHVARRRTLTRSAFARQMFKVGTSRRRPAVGRDADSPFKGEVFETRAGNRWEVVSVSEKLVTVKRAGNRSDGPFAWGRSTLKGMKPVPRPLFGGLFEPKPEAKPQASTQTSLFSQGVNNDPTRRSSRDPRGRGKSKAKAKTKTRKPARRAKAPSRPRTRAPDRVVHRPSGRSSGAQCSTTAIRARKERTEIPPHACLKASKVQSLVFERYCWTVPAARAWAKQHRYKIDKEDVSQRFIRFRQLDPKQYKVVGAMPFQRGLKALLGCLGVNVKKRAKKGAP